MSRFSKRDRNLALLVVMLTLSLALYAAAESGSAATAGVFLGLLAGLMALTILNG